MGIVIPGCWFGSYWYDMIRCSNFCCLVKGALFRLGCLASRDLWENATLYTFLLAVGTAKVYAPTSNVVKRALPKNVEQAHSRLVECSLARNQRSRSRSRAGTATFSFEVHAARLSLDPASRNLIGLTSV
jgi:hypothetical protein